MVGPLPGELDGYSGAAQHIYDHLRRDGPCTQSELVAALNYRRQTITGCIDRLLDAGFVEKRVGTTDARERVYEAVSPADS